MENEGIQSSRCQDCGSAVEGRHHLGPSLQVVESVHKTASQLIMYSWLLRTPQLGGEICELPCCHCPFARLPSLSF